MGGAQILLLFATSGQFPSSDAGVGSDSALVSVVATPSELGIASDSLSLLASLNPAADSATGSESGSISLALVEFGTASEIESLSADIQATDSGVATEGVVAPLVAAIFAFDTGDGDDTLDLLASLATAEDGFSVQSTNLAADLASSDFASLNDVARTSAMAFDSCVGSDSVDMLAQFVSSDAASSTEIASNPDGSFDNVEDVGAALDTPSLNTTSVTSDGAIGAETGIIQAGLSAQADSGVGSDSGLVEVDVLGTDAGFVGESLDIRKVTDVTADDVFGVSVETAVLVADIFASEFGYGHDIGIMVVSPGVRGSVNTSFIGQGKTPGSVASARDPSSSPMTGHGHTPNGLVGKAGRPGAVSSPASK